MPELIVRGAPIPGLAASSEIVLEGGIGAGNVDALKKGLDGILGPGARFVSILMKDMRFLNSSAVNHLVELASRLQGTGGALVLVELPPKLKVMFDNLGVGGYFRYEGGAEGARTALKALASAPPAPKP